MRCFVCKDKLHKHTMTNCSKNLSKEWDNIKNAGKFYEYTSGSNVKAWWKCEKGHSWQTKIKDRFAGRGCPYCSNLKVWPGFNDLASHSPELLEEWDYKKNSFSPKEIVYGSTKKVFWLCENNHSWSCEARDRVRGKRKCPYCPKEHEFSLTKELPISEHLWSDKNDLDASQIKFPSDKKYLFKCDKSLHTDYLDSVNSFVKRKGKCRECIIKKTGLDRRKFISLVDKFPGIKDFWADKNSKKPEEIAYGSLEKVTLCCPTHNYTWEVVAREFIRSNRECPVCVLVRTNKTISGENDLLTTHKDIIDKYWDYTRNKFSPQYYNSKNQHSVYWKGYNNSIPISKAIKNILGNKEINYMKASNILEEHNSFTKNHLELLYLLEENNIDFNNTSIWSRRTVKIKCSEGEDHFWESTIRNVVKREARCIYCNKDGYQKILKGFNDLKTTHPELAKQCINLDPSTVGLMSNVQAIWKCDKNHTWKTLVSSRVTQGTGCPYCTNKKVLAGFNDLATSIPGIETIWGKENDLQPNEILSGKDIPVFVYPCKKHPDNVWETYPYLIRRAYKVNSNIHLFPCSKCLASSGEKEVQDFVESLGFKPVYQTRKVISPLELDIYIPEKNIAIEFNGLYWHSEIMGKDKEYHYNKYKACKDKGIELIQIWEDQWRNKKDIVKNILVHKLGINKSGAICVDQNNIQIIDDDLSKQFLDKYHIDGYVKGDINYGVFDENELIAVAVFGYNSNTEAEVLSFVKSRTATGCMENILLSFKKDHKDCVDLISVVDNQISQSDMYKDLGFNEVVQLPPDYKYFVRSNRVDKSVYSLKTFQNDPDLEYADNKSVMELADLNNLMRVWDSGKTLYHLQLNNYNI